MNVLPAGALCPGMMSAASTLQTPGETSSLSLRSPPTNIQTLKNQDNQASLMGLPYELRLHIYEFLWHETKHKYTVHNDSTNGRTSQRTIERSIEDKNRTRTALLRVNSNISNEAKHTLYSNSDLVVMGIKDRVWPLNYAYPTSIAQAFITSVNVHLIVCDLQFGFPFLPGDYPNLERLQIFVTCGGTLILGMVAWLVYKLVLRTTANLRLKAVAVELTALCRGCSPWSTHNAFVEARCEDILKQLQRFLARNIKCITADVLWRDICTC
jgi:hypothetical protein